MNPTNRRGARGMTMIDAAVVLVLVVLAAIVIVPQSNVRRMARAENAVIDLLTQLDRRIEEYRRSGATDADRDGRGEYASLAEILRDAPDRDEYVRIEGTDVWERSGWYFAVLLPDREKNAVAATAPQVHVDYAEVAKLLVAWPAQPGVTGMRAYARWPGGTLLQHSIDGYPYTRTPPVPHAPLVRIDAGVAAPADRYDGDDWNPPVFSVTRR